MAEREREKSGGERGRRLGVEKNERVGQEGNEGEKGKKNVSEGGQATAFPLCTGHTVLRGELVCVCGGRHVSEVLEVLDDVIAPLSPSLAQDYVT